MITNSVKVPESEVEEFTYKRENGIVGLMDCGGSNLAKINEHIPVRLIGTARKEEHPECSAKERAEEIGRHVTEETKALLHSGTTSYDSLDTARSYLFKEAWYHIIRPEVTKSIESLCELAEKATDILQVGRTHLQDTSPVPFGATLAIYARRLAERVERCDLFFDDLRGKVSGIVGTGASVDIVIGEGMSLEFEEAVLEKLGLKPDYTATQIVQKERLADAGHGLVSLMLVLKDFAEDIRRMYSSAIGEVTSRANAERLGGSSADATKNNPINWENICGKAVLVESGMRILYEMITTDFQRDLSDSVTARYQPQQMMVQTYESFSRLNKKCLPQLSVNEDRMAANLQPVRDNPSEALVAILRGKGWVHPEYGAGHDFIKEMGKRAKAEGIPLYEACLDDSEFMTLQFNEREQAIMAGKLEEHLGSSVKKAEKNIAYARGIAQHEVKNE